MITFITLSIENGRIQNQLEEADEQIKQLMLRLSLK